MTGWEQLFTPVNLQFLGLGLLVTLELALLSALISGAIAVVVGSYRVAVSGPLGWPGTIYVEAIRNLPLLVLIFFLRFGPPAIGVRVDSFTAAVMALSIYNSAYLAEVIRGGLLSIPRGQWEAAAATGLTRIPMYRRVILPQALRNMLPALVSQFVVLVKSTALVSTINVLELTGRGTILYVRHANPLETFALIGIVYFLVNSIISRTAGVFEKKWRSAGISVAE